MQKIYHITNYIKSIFYVINKSLYVEVHMDSALNSSTKIIVYAKDLKNLTEVLKDNYECQGCGVRLIPVSWRLQNTKVEAYFRTLKNHPHQNCEFARAEGVVLNNARFRSVVKELDPLPQLLPLGLSLVDKSNKINNDRGDDNRRNSFYTRKSVNSSDAKKSPSKNSRRSVGNLAPIAHAFVNFPNNRNQSCSIPGLVGNRYIEIFKKLENKITYYKDAKVFYAPLSWNGSDGKPIYYRVASELKIKLFAGKWENENNKSILKENYEIRINCKDWSERSKKILCKQLNTAMEEAKQKRNNKARAWIFFIGTQDLNENSIFTLSDPRLVCAFCDEIIYPDFNSSKIR